MTDSTGAPQRFKPFTTYSTLNKPVMGIVIGVIALMGVLFFAASFREGVNGWGTEETLLGICGLGFLFVAWNAGRFVFSPRVLIEEDRFLISDLYRKREFYYKEILALAEFVRMMPIRYNRNQCLRIPVLAIRLRSGELIQFALPSSQDNQACIDALSNASGLSIESLGVDPSKLEDWRLKT